ncbi:MAG: hypothetical protein ABIQ40_09615 [Bacteroidia bacterium]
MKNYNIKRNREPLTDADISKGQNFDAFLKAYSGAKIPFYKTGTFYMSVIALGVVIGVGAYLLSDEKVVNQSAYVQPALNGIDVADTVFKLDAAEGGEFMYTTGSLIRIPEGGFLDSAGNIVKGNVEIRYREFHNTADVFLAGIPMTYDSAGTKYHFESAGMLEITAWQNGKPLKANPDAPVKVAMASSSDNEKFNVYYLDTMKKNWDFIAKDKAVVVGFEKDTTVKTDANKKGKISSSVSPPLEVKKADKKKPSFVIGFDPVEFPELASYDGVRFQVDEEKTPYNKEDRKITWEDVSILRNKDGATYTVTFTHGVKTSTYITDVVVNAEDYAAAKKVYDAKYAAYQATLKAINDKSANDDKAAEAKLLNADGQRIFGNDAAMKASLARRSAIDRNREKEDMVVREFIIADFGIWNSDCPSSLPEGETLFVKLLDSRTKKPMIVNHVILVEKGRNAVYTYYANDLANFKFNSNAENLLWAVTQDGKLAVCSDADLKAIAGKSEANLTMTVSAEDLKTAEQAKAVLGIGM